MSRLLDHPTLLRVHKAAIDAGLRRDDLLVGLPMKELTRLPRAGAPGPQLLQDLDWLNSIVALTDGSVPLAVWLRNAVHSSDLRVEKAVFEGALRTVEAAKPAPPPKAPPHEPSERVAAAGAVPVYVSFAPKDEGYLDSLEAQLAPLQRSGDIQLRHRRQIPAGEDVEKCARAKLDGASLVLLLLSPDFVSGDVTWGEMTQAIANGITVWPILVRPVSLAGTPVEHLKSRPASGVPISRSPDQDEELQKIADDLRATVKP